MINWVSLTHRNRRVKVELYTFVCASVCVSVACLLVPLGTDPECLCVRGSSRAVVTCTHTHTHRQADRMTWCEPWRTADCHTGASSHCRLNLGPVVFLYQQAVTSLDRQSAGPSVSQLVIRWIGRRYNLHQELWRGLNLVLAPRLIKSN